LVLVWISEADLVFASSHRDTCLRDDAGRVIGHYFMRNTLRAVSADVPKLQARCRRNRKQSPYPYTVFDNGFKPERLREVLAELPDLAQQKKTEVFDNTNEKKIASVGEEQFSDRSLALMHFLNSLPFLQFLEQLTSIPNLIPDPHFIGGGFHEIKPGGFLKVHVDFNKHYGNKLDRRLNVLVYLNENWQDSYGGHFELRNDDMSKCVKQVAPLFNRMVVFSTIPGSYHGHPDPLTCPPDRSRRSLALHCYTNGRPDEEVSDAHSTVWKNRKGIDADEPMLKNITRGIKTVVKEVTPPVVTRVVKKLR